MPRKACTCSPSSPRPCSERGAGLLACADLPGLALARGEESGPGLPRHAHASLVLGLTLHGERLLTTPRGELRAPAGHALVIPPGLAHSCGCACGVSCAYLALCLDPAAQPLPEFAQALALPPGPITQALAALAEAVEQPSGALERQSLLANCLELLAELAGSGEDAGTPQAMPEEVGRARALLEATLAENRGWPEIAASCGAEPLALHRAFVRSLGLPPHLWQTHARLRRAKELLRAGAELASAAQEAGFSDQSHMNRHFARLVGLTPAQYARAFRSDRPVRPVRP